jgi:hypothetical protein
MRKIDTVFNFNVRLIQGASQDCGSINVQGNYVAAMGDGGWVEDIQINKSTLVETSLITFMEYVRDEWGSDLARFMDWLYAQVSDHCNVMYVDDEDYDMWIHRQLL